MQETIRKLKELAKPNGLAYSDGDESVSGLGDVPRHVDVGPGCILDTRMKPYIYTIT